MNIKDSLIEHILGGEKLHQFATITRTEIKHVLNHDALNGRVCKM